MSGVDVASVADMRARHMAARARLWNVKPAPQSDDEPKGSRFWRGGVLHGPPRAEPEPPGPSPRPVHRLDVNRYGEKPIGPVRVLASATPDAVAPRRDDGELVDGSLPPRLAVLVEAACVAFEAPLNQFLSGRKEPALVRARQAAFMMARVYTRLSYPAIGRAVSRDHTTVLYAARVGRERFLTEPGFAAACRAAAIDLGLDPDAMTRDAAAADEAVRSGSFRAPKYLARMVDAAGEGAGAAS